MRSSWFNKLSIIIGHRSPVNWLFLCLISLLLLIFVLGSSSSNIVDLAPHIPVSLIYTNYRRVKEQAAVDYLELRSVARGVSRQREFDLCGKERENFVPCYNVSSNLVAGFKEGEEFDRHCELLVEAERCLVRPPTEYKIPFQWPTSRDVIWSGNVKITRNQFLSSGSMTKRLMLLEENQIAFRSEDDGVKDYSRQIAEMIGLGSDNEFPQAGVRTILDINCGFGSFAAHLASLNIMTVCVAAYEATGSQVQLALERGLPAVIGNFVARELPFPSLSYGIVHCAQCGIIWDEKDGIFLVEVDRVLKPGGYFVLTSTPSRSQESSSKMKRRNMLKPVEELAQQLCWTLLAQQDELLIWQKTADVNCYASRKKHDIPLCKEFDDVQSYYRPLEPCIRGTSSKRWIAIQNRSSGSDLSSEELKINGVQSEDYFEDLEFWRSTLKNYWSLLTPLIFSDHPKRPGDEDPLPPFNMIRNVMDMNTKYGGLNSALLEEKKSVWVMNVVPATVSNSLPLILDKGFVGVVHDWCEPFPTYPRTYDMLHASGLLSHLTSERCSMVNLFLEMDRILRPEGWVILSDNMQIIEMARTLAAQVRWEARIINLQNGSDQLLLVCQKPFLKK
ncbi:probable methyltransferase PMT4 isoform X1 [Vigna unguiculata]|uniref:probable methyltransferase PMT4 isoform X1 n=3 Tax=Vigna unguiculata TaxID=3917 RepID=UPI001016165C|nr:probable methyltransferase PMT4 isoform X1 [Vigna unguiculata]XP_027913522.1 probable methyltransferase PMT4 isoform X1 [Vigna unguiculata]XP_027913523.1 probable methyltransferase PMT4 isoform X1 [Vigna unguiculata]